MATEVASLLAEGVARVQRVTDQPRLEAEILLGAALGQSRAWLLAHADERILDCDATDRYEAYVTRRARDEPVAYILGTKDFWSLTLEVTPEVLIPRPETELLVEWALEPWPAQVARRALDLGTGSGAIALALAHERPAAVIVGTDVAGAAVTVARRNAARLGLTNVEFREGDWFEPVATERFDLIVSNPPYIAAADPRVAPGVRRYEPHGALYAADEGLAALRGLAAGAPGHLHCGGVLRVEHGLDQGPAVRELLQRAGFADVATRRDLAGHERCTGGTWRGGGGA